MRRVNVSLRGNKQQEDQLQIFFRTVNKRPVLLRGIDSVKAPSSDQRNDLKGKHMAKLRQSVGTTCRFVFKDSTLKHADKNFRISAPRAAA